MKQAYDPGASYARCWGKAREALNVFNWLDLFRCAAPMNAGQVAPSRMLPKIAVYSRQTDRTAALRGADRIERILLII